VCRVCPSSVAASRPGWACPAGVGARRRPCWPARRRRRLVGALGDRLDVIAVSPKRETMRCIHPAALARHPVRPGWTVRLRPCTDRPRMGTHRRHRRHLAAHPPAERPTPGDEVRGQVTPARAGHPINHPRGGNTSTDPLIAVAPGWPRRRESRVSSMCLRERPQQGLALGRGQRPQRDRPSRGFPDPDRSCWRLCCPGAAGRIRPARVAGKARLPAAGGRGVQPGAAAGRCGVMATRWCPARRRPAATA
jgi:hypothetical protein